MKKTFNVTAKGLISFVLITALASQSIGAAPAAKPAAPAAAGKTGTVRGKVLDSANGEPMIGVTAFIKELGLSAVTDIDGNYSIPNVPYGDHSITYQMGGYQTQSVGVKVNAARVGAGSTAMSPRVSEVIVTGKRLDNTSAALLSKRKKAAAAQDAISAEQIAKTPDADASEAAKRVTGITVVDGKYVYVRGLGERYSSVQFNGSTLPSPNPDKRVIPLDIFPSALLDNLIVTKTYTVDLPAEFSGGLVQINPKDYPEEKEIKLTLSTGFNSVTTGKTFYGSQGGKYDFFGIDDGTRSLPSSVGDKKVFPYSSTYTDGYQPSEIAAIAKTFNNTWGINKKNGIMPLGLQASFGNTFKLGEQMTLGVVAAGLAREQSETFADKTFKTFFSPGSVRLDYKQNISTYSTTKGGLLGLTFGLDKHNKFKLNSMYTNNTEDTVQETIGSHPDLGKIRDVRIKYNVYNLLFNQLSGEHALPWLFDSKFTWKSSYSRATFNQPDYRTYTQQYGANGTTTTVLTREDSPSRIYTNHLDETVDFQPEISVPFKQWGGLKSTASVGGYISYRDRGSKTRRFQYTSNNVTTGQLSGDIGNVMNNDNVTASGSGATGFGFQEVTGPNDAYRGQQLIQAGYGQVDLPIIPDLRLVAGARYEQSQIVVTTYDIFSSSAPIKSVVSNKNVSPSLNLIYALTPDMNLRAAGSVTFNRPDFRELTPFVFLGAAGVDVLKGNTSLQQAQIINGDLRYEWFPGIGEVIAVSAFFKDLTNPIEVTELASTDSILSYANVPKATLYGTEIEASKGLGFVNKMIEEFSVFTNFSLIKSQVDLPAGGFYTNTSRPLQGQSPWVVNAGINYDKVPWGLNVSVLYNIFGPRIIRVGAGGLDDTYEQPVGRLDTVVKKSFGNYGSLKASAANILNAEYRAMQGNDLRYSYYRGINFGLSYEYKF
ncbi:MAG: TonB-dependent receptor [Turneriella sp.]|nr:TonB-dependent receptor [Turneriella sp.]